MVEKAELVAALNYLSLGAADVTVKSKIALVLAKKGSEPFNISAMTLANLAAKNWIRRDGKRVQITDLGLSQVNALNMQVARPTETIQLVEDGVSRNVTRVLNESPIDYLVSRKDKNGAPMLGRDAYLFVLRQSS